MRRMDRYKDEESTNRSSRSDKYEELYKDLNSNIKYADITDVSNTNAYDISNTYELHNSKSRENYHKIREYEAISPDFKEKRELEEFNNLNKSNENKVYDINTIIEEARRNRERKEQEEEKKKEIKEKYNILSNLDKKELEKYRKEKKERQIPTDEEEIREIIDTITSKTLAGDITKETTVDLLSDLMATQALDRVAAQATEEYERTIDDIEPKYKTEIDIEPTAEEEEKEVEEQTEEIALKQEEIEEVKKEAKKKPKKKKEESIMEAADNSFYTKSMDLSDKDFAMSDEFDEEDEMPFILKFLIFIIILMGIAAAGYYLYMHYFH